MFWGGPRHYLTVQRTSTICPQGGFMDALGGTWFLCASRHSQSLKIHCSLQLMPSIVFSARHSHSTKIYGPPSLALSTNLPLSLILCPSCYSPDLLLQSVSDPVAPPDTFCGNQYAYVLFGSFHYTYTGAIRIFGQINRGDWMLCQWNWIHQWLILSIFSARDHLRMNQQLTSIETCYNAAS